MYYEVLVRISPGYPSVTGRLHTRYSPVRRSPSVSASWHHAAPRLACVRPVASVHPEPGSNSSLYLFFFFIIPSKRYLTELTSFSLLLLYYTCFFNSFNELFLSLTAAPWPPRFAKVLQRYCLSLLHSKYFSMFFLNYFSMKWKLFLFQIVIAKIFLPLHRTIKVIWNANAISRL